MLIVCILLHIVVVWHCSILSTSFRVTSLALGKSYEAVLKYVRITGLHLFTADDIIMVKHNTTKLCTFCGTYPIMSKILQKLFFCNLLFKIQQRFKKVVLVMAWINDFFLQSIHRSFWDTFKFLVIYVLTAGQIYFKPGILIHQGHPGSINFRCWVEMLICGWFV